MHVKQISAFPPPLLSKTCFIDFCIVCSSPLVSWLCLLENIEVAVGIMDNTKKAVIITLLGCCGCFCWNRYGQDAFFQLVIEITSLHHSFLFCFRLSLILFVLLICTSFNWVAFYFYFQLRRLLKGSSKSLCLGGIFLSFAQHSYNFFSIL
jgi:hypothetical protein